MRYHPLAGVGVERLVAALALRLDLLDAAEGHARTGPAWTEREHLRFEGERIRQILAEVARRRGQHVEAQEHLGAAARPFEQHGALLYLRQVEQSRESLWA